MRTEKSHATAASIFADHHFQLSVSSDHDDSRADSNLHDMLDVVHVLANTGMRPGEFNKLRLRDIDVGKGRAFIASAIGWRYVPLGPKSQQALVAAP